MDREADKMCRSCHACQFVGPPASPPLVKTKALPNGPWEELAADLLLPLLGGEYALVLFNYYSRFYEVDVIKYTVSDSINRYVDTHFSRHGIPNSIRTNNSPPFNSSSFSDLLTQKGVRHVRNTPLWQRSNGEVDCQNRSLMKAIRAAHIKKRNLRSALNEFLLAYSSTPHPAT